MKYSLGAMQFYIIRGQSNDIYSSGQSDDIFYGDKEYSNLMINLVKLRYCC